MRRIIMLLAIAAMLLAMSAPPALAQSLGDIPPPGDKEPGNAQPPKTEVINPTEQHGKNLIGESASNFVKGPGGNPGSAAQPTTFGGEDAFNGPVTSRIGTLDPVESKIFPNSTKPNVISALQEETRCSLLGPPSCPEA
jgi:hypothetical protein